MQFSMNIPGHNTCHAFGQFKPNQNFIELTLYPKDRF